MISVVLAVFLGILLYEDHVETMKQSEELNLLSRQFYEEEKALEAARKQKENEDSFYQKLADGFDVNILIVGDSIGEGAGCQTDGKQWYKQMQHHLNTNYRVRVGLTNVSMGGNTSYAGYVRTMALDDGVDYDLAIICYGQNDGPDGFAVNYESIIQAIRRKYPDCSIISILESSQREYTEKMTTIQGICGYYKIPMADTISAFQGSGIAYEALSGDGVHPNDAGQDIYFETVKKVIDQNVSDYAGKMENIPAITEQVGKFTNFQWYGVGKDGFERLDDTTFVMKISASGILGIDYTFESGDNRADIYIDGVLYKSPTVSFNYDFSQRHIMVVSEACYVEDEIKVIFSTKEQADGFRGVCFSWE